MSSKKFSKVAVLRGGVSDEKEISIMTANQVFSTLKTRYNIKIIDVTNNCQKFISDLIKYEPDKIFNCLHGFFGEDGQVQSILNYLKIPYTHSGVLASSLAMNKVISKKFYQSLGVKCPKIFENLDVNNIKFPVIVKPVCGGSSNGIIKIESIESLNKIRNELTSKHLMIEEYIEGREITVGILDNKICGIMEIISDSEIYDFKNKYLQIAKHVVDPEIPERIREYITNCSLDIHKKMNCSCLSRLDFRFNEQTNEIYLLEINTQPGLTKNSLLPEMAKNSGINFFQLCEIILSHANCE